MSETIAAAHMAPRKRARAASGKQDLTQASDLNTAVARLHAVSARTEERLGLLSKQFDETKAGFISSSYVYFNHSSDYRLP